MEKDLIESPSNPLSLDKKLAFYDKMFIAYQDAKRHIREDLVGFSSLADNFHLTSYLLRTGQILRDLGTCCIEM